MDLQFVTQFMLQHFEQTTASSGGTHFLARCLLCGDSRKNPYKKRFNLDYNNGVPGWHCWNCGKKGNFIEIYSIVKGISYDDAKLELFKKKWEDKELKDKLEKYHDKIRNPKLIKQPEEENFNWIKDKSFTIYDEENRYVRVLKAFYKSRKIPEVYRLHICYEGRYRNRIIIPIFNKNNNIIYFQARRIPDTMLEPKYDNPATPKELCILNSHLFDKNKSIIIHEGLIDAFMVEDHQGTSCLGKEISEDLIFTLSEFTKTADIKYEMNGVTYFDRAQSNLIVALDNDAEAYKALSKFMKTNKFATLVKYFLYPQVFGKYDDINSIVRAEKGLNVYDLITQNSVNYSTALAKLSISKLLGGNRNENNSSRK